MAATTGLQLVEMVPIGNRQQVVKLKGGVAYTVKPNYPIGVQADGYGRIVDHALLFDTPLAGFAMEEVEVVAGDADGGKEVLVTLPWRFVMPKTSAAQTDIGQHAYIKHNNEIVIAVGGLTYAHDVGVVVDVIGSTHVIVQVAVTIGQVLNESNVANAANLEAGMMFVIRADWTDTGTGDITITTPSSVKMRIFDVVFVNHAANGANANKIQVAASAAGADPITDAASLNNKVDKDVVRAATIDDDGTGIIAASTTLFLRQTKIGGTMGGTAYIYAMATA